MPIYAYACGACGFKKDVLQKLSDAPLTDCPSCGEPQFSKQLTAPGFVLKGSGWYATDFREGQKKPAESGDGATDSAAPESAPPTGGAASAPQTPTASTSAPPPAAPAPAAASSATVASPPAKAA
jgi:putative FmdB family regulatory protein